LKSSLTVVLSPKLPSLVARARAVTWLRAAWLRAAWLRAARLRAARLWAARLRAALTLAARLRAAAVVAAAAVRAAVNRCSKSQNYSTFNGFRSNKFLDHDIPHGLVVVNKISTLVG
jgi:hypothetical protein